MSFLPVVERELRAAARGKSTARVRWWTALIAMVMSFCSLGFLSLTSNRPTGNPLFSILTGYAFAFCAFAGVFLTADSLSEEKREGTLGLLFLTDLKGYDIVLGKFFARSLSAFYGLFALLPVTGIPLVIGGVTGNEFWRMALALANTLFVSLSLGMGVSALARNPREAIAGTFGLVLLLIAGLPLLAEFLKGTRSFEWISPFYPFYRASDSVFAGNPGAFWRALIGSNLLGCAFIAGASLLLPRRWQERGISEKSGIRRLTFTRGIRFQQRRQHRLSVNPVYWLITREANLNGLAWVIVLLWAVVVSVWTGHKLLTRDELNLGQLYYPAKAGGFLLKMLFALQACRFFAEARRSGALELLLATPLRNRDILRGQWLALRRILVWPLVAFLLLDFIPAGGQLARAWLTSDVSAIFGQLAGLGMSSIVVLWLALGMFADVSAIAYVGTWLALTMKKPALASPMTILLVLVIPSIGFCGLDLLIDLLFIVWASAKLSEDLRWTVSRPYQQRLPIPPRPFPIPPRSPPVISSNAVGERGN